jgi:hypothetical protein
MTTTYIETSSSNSETPGTNPQLDMTLYDREANLLQTIAQLEARIAELERPAALSMPLKAAALDCNVKYETARIWAVSGLIEARREGKRWLVNVVSLRTRVQLLLQRPPAST